MRLRSCIALELLTGGTLFAGLVAGGIWGSQLAREGLAHEAQAATELPAPARVVEPVPLPPPVSPHTELEVIPETPTMFLGVEDDILLAPLRDSPIAQVKFNTGGSSISLRIDFENGARAAFKPRQTNWQSVPRREVIAFRINRLLGLGSVPPAIGRRFQMSKIVGALTPESRFYRPRLQAEMIQKGGWVTGELSWWIPVIRRGKVDGYEIDSMEGIVSWKRYLAIGAKIPERDLALVQQISDMVLFDFIISNPDRWSGGNARVSEDQRLLYFMDNTLSFGDRADGHPKSRTYFERCHTFSRSLVERLRTLEEEEIREVLERDIEPFDYYLRDSEITALLSRRDRALKYIDALIRRHGEELVLAFP
ncbi:MAG: hypothetical protein GY811_00105 [Myxococcales bacterium]|nr:hypothetical protein [Myxococcales bacterium]